MLLQPKLVDMATQHQVDQYLGDAISMANEYADESMKVTKRGNFMSAGPNRTPNLEPTTTDHSSER